MEKLPILLRRLDFCCFRVMMCQIRTYAEFLPVYWQLKLLKQSGSDLTGYKWYQNSKSIRLNWSEDEGIEIEFGTATGEAS